jgi:hypothetical protein
MPTEIIDLDVVLDEPKRVRLGGNVYTLPPQIPVPLYLKIKARQESPDESDDVLEGLHQQVLELFQVHQPDMTAVPAGMGQLFQIIPAVYGAGPDPKKGTTTGRTGSAKRPNSARAKRKVSRS